MSDEQDYKDYLDYIEYQKHTSGSPAPAQPEQPEQPSTLKKVAGFASNLPQSAIDLIPGMKDKRESNDAAKEQFYQSHPKPVTGEEDPAYQAMGLMGPESVIGMAKSGASALKGVGNKLTNFLKPAAERADVLDNVKNITQLEPYVQNQVNQARELFNKKQIAPRMLEQESRLAGNGDIPNTIKINPQELVGVSPELDKYAASLGSNPIEIPATEGLQLRKMLNESAGWKQHPMDATRAQAVDAKAADLHQKLAKEFSSIDPAMDPLSQEMQQAYTTQKNAVGSAGKNPIGSVLQSDNAAGLAKKGRLAAFDQMADSDLSTLGQNIKTANDRSRPTSLGDIFSIHGPKQVATKLASPALNAYDSAAQSALNTPAMSSSDKLKALLQKYSGIQGSGE